MSVDPRWDSPLFTVYETADLRPHMGHDKIVRPGYPAAWERCPRCRGIGRQTRATSMPVRDRPTDRLLSEECTWCFGTGAIKHLVRELTGHRCIRCKHPFRVGSETIDWETVPVPPEEQGLIQLFDTGDGPLPERKPKRVAWSPCDPLCEHGGPTRFRYPGNPRWTVAEGEPLSPGRSWPWPERLVEGCDVQAAYRILTVHHANEHKADCRWWNLLSLCQRCHLQIQGKVQMDRVWPHEHTAWFKPYVAGFYAWRYEERNITRAEAEERMDELLAYERAVTP